MALLLTRGDLQRVLEFSSVIDAVDAAFRAYSSGKTETPLRVGVEPQGTSGVLLAMPCAVAEPPALGAKIVSVFRANRERGLSTVTSTYVLAEYDTGVPLSIMDGGYLTAIRTAAGSAVATRALARTDARTLGVFGTGVQARFHVEMIRRVRDLHNVLVCGTSSDKAEAFARWVTDATGIDCRAASPQEAAAADVVALCTTATQPVLQASDVRSGAHVNAVGAFTPTTREMPTDLVARGAVYVDTRAGAFSEAGDLLIPVDEGVFRRESVLGEVGEVLLGTAPGRASQDQVTVYKSVGAAFLDAATAHLAYEQATHEGVGTLYGFDVE